MNELRKLEVGCATKFAIMDENGAEKVFKLAITSVPGWRDEDRRYGFCYINDDGFGKIIKVSGTYSGGITGSGVSSYDLNHGLEENEIVVTADFEKIKKMADQATSMDKANSTARESRLQAAAEEINKLPKLFYHIESSGGISYKIQHNGFEYNPGRSDRLQGGYSIEKNDHYFHPGDYYRKDGVMLKKKVATDVDYLVGNKNLNEAITIIVQLREKMKEANNAVRTIWDKAKYVKEPVLTLEDAL